MQLLAASPKTTPTSYLFMPHVCRGTNIQLYIAVTALCHKRARSQPNSSLLGCDMAIKPSPLAIFCLRHSQESILGMVASNKNMPWVG